MNKTNEKKDIQIFFYTIIFSVFIGILINLVIFKFFELNGDKLRRSVADPDGVIYMDSGDYVFGGLPEYSMNKNINTYRNIGIICSFIVSYILILKHGKNAMEKLLPSNLIIIAGVLFLLTYKFNVKLPEDYSKYKSVEIWEMDSNKEYNNEDKYKEYLLEKIGFYNEKMYDQIVNKEMTREHLRNPRDIYIPSKDGKYFRIVNREVEEYENYSNLRLGVSVSFSKSDLKEDKTIGEVLTFKYKNKQGGYKTIKLEEENKKVSEVNYQTININIPFDNDTTRIYMIINNMPFIISTEFE